MGFGCYSDACKARSATIVMGISLLIGLLGVICLAMGAMSSGYVQEQANIGGFELPGFNSSYLTTAIMGLGVVAVLVSICGCLTAKKKTCIFTGSFMGCSFLIGVVLLAFAALVLGFAGKIVDRLQKDGCKEILKIKDGKATLPDQYDEFVGGYMCTE